MEPSTSVTFGRTDGRDEGKRLGIEINLKIFTTHLSNYSCHFLQIWIKASEGTQEVGEDDPGSGGR